MQGARRGAYPPLVRGLLVVVLALWTLPSIAGAQVPPSPEQPPAPFASEADAAFESDDQVAAPASTEGSTPAAPPPGATGGPVPPPPDAGYAAPPGYGTAPAQARPPTSAFPSPRSRAVRVRYEEGMAMPAGASVVTRYNKALLIPGLIGFLVTYSMNLVASTLDQDLAIAAVPLAGFPVLLARDGREGDAPLVGIHTVVQAASLVLLVLGLIPRRYVEYSTLADRSNDRRWSIAPRLGRGDAGLALTWF